MSNTLKIELAVETIEDNNSNSPTNICKSSATVSETSTSKSRNIKEIITDSTVDQVINIPESNTEYLVIFSDQNISIKLNGSSDSIALNVKVPGKKTPVFMNRGDIDSLTISNSSGSSANLEVILAKI